MTESQDRNSWNGKDTEAAGTEALLRVDPNKTLKDRLHGEPPPKQLGDFQIECEIGRGGMGVVYEALELSLNRKVAVKVLPDSRTVSRVQIERFLIEAQAAATLNHDNIVPIYHVGDASGIRYFAMKLIRGRNLYEIFRSAAKASSARGKQVARTTLHAENQGSTVKDPPEIAKRNVRNSIDLSLDTLVLGAERGNVRFAGRLAKSVAQIGLQVAEALHHAHEHGIVHRDVKPSNLMLDESHRAWVTDFGLAQLQDAPSLTRTGDVVGTLRYMSPEQASGRRGFVDNRTDVYSLGVTLYEIATLRRAYRGETARELLREITFERLTPVSKINPALPTDFATIITKATERNPNDRYQTAAAMAEDLRRFIDGKPILAKPPAKTKRIRDWFFERPLVTASIAAATLFMLATASILAMEYRDNAIRSQIMLTESEGRRSLAQATLEQERDPGLALALAVQGATAAPGFEANRTLLGTLSHLHEARTIRLEDTFDAVVIYSPDGNQLLRMVSGRYYDAKANSQVYDARTGELLGEIKLGHSITTATYSPDGRYLLVAGTSFQPRGPYKTFEQTKCSVISVLDAETFEVIQTINDSHALHLSPAVFSSTSPNIVVPTADNHSEVFNTDDWRTAEMTLRGHQAPILQAIYSPDGKYIATWSEDGTLGLYDGKKGNRIDSIEYASDRILDVNITFSPSGNKLMIQGGKQTLFCNVPALNENRFRTESDAVFAKIDDQVLLVDIMGDRYRLWDPDADIVLSEHRFEDGIGMCTPIGNGYMAARISESLAIVDLQSGDVVGQCLGHQGFPLFAVVHPDKQQFATYALDQTIRIWNVQSDEQARTLGVKLDFPGVPLLDIGPNQTQVLVGTVANFKTYSRSIEVPAQLLPFSEGTLRSLLEDGRIVTMLNDRRIAIWNPETSRIEATVRIPGSAVLDITQRPGTNLVLMLNFVGELFQWNFVSGETTQLNPVGSAVSGLVTDQASGRVFIGSSNGMIYVLEPEQSLIASRLQLESPVLHLDLARNGNLLAATTEEGKIHVVSTAANEITNSLAPDFPVTEAWFAGGDDFIVAHAGPHSDCIGLLRIEDRAILARVERSFVEHVDFTSDRKLFAFACDGDGAFLWDITTQETTNVSTENCVRVRFAADKLLLATQTREVRDGLFRRARPPAKKSKTDALHVWDIAAQKILSSSPLEIQPTEILYVAGEQKILISGRSYGAALVDLESGETAKQLRGHSGVLALAKFSNGNRIGITVSESGIILKQDLTAGKHEEIGRLEYPLKSAELTPDRRLLLTVDQTEQSILWDLESGTQEVIDLEQLTQRGSTTISSVSHAIGPNSTRVASTLGDLLRIWDLRTREGTTLEFEGGLHEVSWTPDERQLLALPGRPRGMASRFATDRTGEVPPKGVLLINAETKDHEIVLADQVIIDAQFIDSGDAIVALSEAAQIFVVDTKTFKPRFSPIKPDPRCNVLLSMHAGSKTVFAASPKHVAGWDATTGVQLWEFNNEISVDSNSTLKPWTLHRAGSDWMFYFDDFRIRKIPLDPLSYAAQRIPRSLTPSEESKFALQSSLTGQD